MVFSFGREVGNGTRRRETETQSFRNETRHNAATHGAVPDVVAVDVDSYRFAHSETHTDTRGRTDFIHCS